MVLTHDLRGGHAVDLGLGQRGSAAQEVLVDGHVNVEVGAVGAETGVQTGCAAGAEVTADVGRADEEGLGLHLGDDVADDLGIGVGGVGSQQGALADNDLVGAVAAQLLSGGLNALAAQQQTAQVHAQLVGQVAALGDQLEIGGHQLALALLAEHPYILESSDVSTVEVRHNSSIPFLR